MWKVNINSHVYYFDNVVEAAAFARYWKCRLPYQVSNYKRT
jgi:hypothetical protein